MAPPTLSTTTSHVTTQDSVVTSRAPASWRRTSVKSSASAAVTVSGCWPFHCCASMYTVCWGIKCKNWNPVASFSPVCWCFFRQNAQYWKQVYYRPRKKCGFASLCVDFWAKKKTLLSGAVKGLKGSPSKEATWHGNVINVQVSCNRGSFLLWIWTLRGATVLVHSLPVKCRKGLAYDVIYTSATPCWPCSMQTWNVSADSHVFMTSNVSF